MTVVAASQCAFKVFSAHQLLYAGQIQGSTALKQRRKYEVTLKSKTKMRNAGVRFRDEAVLLRRRSAQRPPVERPDFHKRSRAPKSRRGASSALA